MKRTLLMLIACLAIVAAACGGGEASTTTSQATTTTTAVEEVSTTTTEAATTTTEAAPEASAKTFTSADGVEVEITDTSRVVSLTGDLTEIMFELGLGESVVAIDVTTTYPDAATELPVIGFAQQLAAEPVLAFEPTLVIGDMTIAPAESIQQLRDAGIPVMLFENPTSLDGIATKITQVADVLGVPDAGATLAARVQGEIDDALALAAGAETTPTIAFVYVRGPQVVLLFGQGMPTQAMIEGAHAVDAGALAQVFGAVPLTPEALVASAPDIIVLPEAGLAALGGTDAFLEIPGVAETPAGQTGSFLSYDEAYFFNFGPRVGQALKQFVTDVHPELG
jgi:iron complex transport system substrate-binding protein